MKKLKKSKILTSNRGEKMKRYFLILTLFITGLFARNTEPQTGWFYDQSTLQAFYMLETVTIDGEVAPGDGTGASDLETPGSCGFEGGCDVVGAFIDRDGVEVCVGWVYNDAGSNVTTVPLMGNDGSSSTLSYLTQGEPAYLKIYDATYGSTLSLTAASTLPGWENNNISVITGESTANHTPGCTDENACNFDASATADIDGVCWSANDGCSCDDGQGSVVDCAGVCNGTSALDDCGVCDGGNADQDCAGDCFGNSAVDNCGVCDDDLSNDDVTCTGCTNPDADNAGDGCADNDCSIDDGSCVFTVPGATDLTATAGQLRVSLEWNAPEDSFESTQGYTYLVRDELLNLVKTSSGTGTTVTADAAGNPLLEGVEYCFQVLAVHNEYGASNDDSNQACAIPEAASGAPTWRLQLKASLDSYDQFANTGNEEWVLKDNTNYLGVASDATWGYDYSHDIPEPATAPGNYVSLYFDHPEWESDLWGGHFTEDIVLDDDAFFSTNLTQWDGTVVSNVPGSATINISVETGPVPSNYEMYIRLHDQNNDQDGIGNGSGYSENDQWYRIPHQGSVDVEFYMTAAGHQNFSVVIGNIVPQSPDNLVATPHYNSITLDWDEDGTDLSDIGNRYPALTYNVYRDDEPADPNGNQGTYTPGDGPGGCGGLLTGPNGQGNSDYNDNVDLYAAYPDEGLLQESTYSYTVTGSNLAGESSYGHTVRMSGGAEEYFLGRDSRDTTTTGLNKDPVVRLAHVLSPTTEPGQTNLTNIGDGLYEIPHNFDPDENRIEISIDGSETDDEDYPYGIDRYTWTQTAGNGDLQDQSGLETNTVTFTVGNPHENGDKSYTWKLYVETDHPVKNSGSCGVWTSELDTHSDEAELSVTIREEPNSDPDASSALGLIRGGDDLSVLTMNNFDDSDFNDYDAIDQAWYEPHDGSGDQNDADAWFSADQSTDADGKCTTGSFGDGQTCDHQNYTWRLTKGALAGFSFDDLNGDGIYNYGEPFTLQNGSEIYEDANLGDHLASGPATELLSGQCNSCTGEVYQNGGHITEDGSYGYNGNVGIDASLRGSRDLHLSLGSEDSSGDQSEGSDSSQEVYILSMTVTDVYGDSDDVSLLVLVKDERNAAPTVGAHREQSTYYMRHDENTRDTYIVTGCDNLSSHDSDNDSQTFTWAYSGPGAFDANGDVLDVSSFNSSYTHTYLPNAPDYEDSSVDNTSGWKDMEAWLVEGEHTFTFTTVDGYGATNSSSTTFTILDEPGAKQPSINIDHTGLKYAIISVHANAWVDADFPDDACHGDTYSGNYPDYNTSRLRLYNGDEQIAEWLDNEGTSISQYTRNDRVDCADTQLANDVSGDVAIDVLTHIDKSIAAETEFNYTVKSWNSELDNQTASVLEVSASTRTHDRPDVVVNTPNGAEIRSTNDDYNVEFTTYFDSNDNSIYDEGDIATGGQYINKIDVIYLSDGITEEPGVDEFGIDQSTSNGPNVNGCSNSGGDSTNDDTASATNCHQGDATLVYSISDNLTDSEAKTLSEYQNDNGNGINYHARVGIRVTDVGDYDGCEQETHDDFSDNPFTMAHHEIERNLSSGWHLVGAPLTPCEDNVILKENFGESLGTWGQDWVAYDWTGEYDGLDVNLGQGYYLALGNDDTFVQKGDPVVADEDCVSCDNANSGNDFTNVPSGNCTSSGATANLNLKKGWNLVANPLTNKVSKGTLNILHDGGSKLFEDAVDAGWIAPSVYGWFENSYTSIDRIVPFSGYWINTSRALDIEVRPHLYEDGELTRKTESLALKIDLKASDLLGEGIGDVVTIGLSDDANDEFVWGEDEEDLPLNAYKAMGGEYIDLKVGSSLIKDIRSTDFDSFQSWTVAINKDKVDNDIELSWTNINTSHDDLTIVIDDVAIDMNSENSVQISSDIESVVIVAGSYADYSNPVPEAFGLGSAYPNPFNPSTTLELALDQNGMVNMSVYNVRGQVVEVLVNRDMKAGFHNIVWNASGVPSGMYFVKVATGSNVAVQKMMLLK